MVRIRTGLSLCEVRVALDGTTFRHAGRLRPPSSRRPNAPFLVWLLIGGWARAFLPVRDYSTFRRRAE
jgi:hypothetical protein